MGFLQDYVLGCLGCLWFERNEQKDRLAVSRRYIARPAPLRRPVPHSLPRSIKEHIKDVKKNPLLIFPEGTCVNNEYCVMFKRGVRHRLRAERAHTETTRPAHTRTRVNATHSAEGAWNTRQTSDLCCRRSSLAAR